MILIFFLEEVLTALDLLYSLRNFMNQRSGDILLTMAAVRFWFLIPIRLCLALKKPRNGFLVEKLL